MKRTNILFLATLFISIQAFSENKEKTEMKDQQPQTMMQKRSDFIPHIRVNAYTFYAFDDKVDSYYSSDEYYRGKIEGGFQWGAGLEYIISPGQGIEVSYLRLDTKAPMEYYKNGIQFSNFDVATNYVMIGGNRYFPLGGQIEPFVGAQVGLGIFSVDNPDNGNSRNGTKFAWSIKAGVNLWASERVGLKLQTGLISAVQAVGGGLYFGTGGVGGGLETYSSFYQFYIGGGLSFDLAK